MVVRWVGAGLLAAIIAAGGGGAGAKTLRLNITADPSQMDPITESELIAGDILRNIYDELTTIDKDGKITPSSRSPGSRSTAARAGASTCARASSSIPAGLHGR